MSTLAAPSNLKLKRSKYKFTASWSSVKKAKKYHYRFAVKDNKKWKVWKSGTVTNTKVAWNMAAYDKDEKCYPYKQYYPYSGKNTSNDVEAVRVTVWADGGKESSKPYKFKNPTKPAITLTREDNSTELVIKIEADDDESISDDGNKVCTRVAYAVKRTCNGTSTWVTKGKDDERSDEYIWHDGSGDITKTYTIPEGDVSPDSPVAYLVKAYSAGPAGKSDVVSATHSISSPNAPVLNSVTQLTGTKGGGYELKWSIKETTERPVTKFVVQYRDIDADGTEGNWQDVEELLPGARSTETDPIEAPADNAKRYWRVLAYNDENWTASNEVQCGTGSIAKADEVTVSTENGVTVVSWSFDSVPSGAYHIRIYRDGEIVADDVSITATSWEDTTSDGGTHTYSVQIVSDDGATYSATTDSDETATPGLVSDVTAVGQEDGTSIYVTWTSSGQTTGGTQVGWSDDSRAIYSNEQPSTANFAATASSAYITGLDSGTTYYVWVRTYIDDSYSAWVACSGGSDTAGVLLAAEPTQPALALARTWVRLGASSVQAAWSYTTDNDSSTDAPQLSAVVEASADGSTWTQIAHVSGDADTVSCDTSGLSAGTWSVRVTVTNAAGSATSEAVSLLVATKPTCSIASTSLSSATDVVEDTDGNEDEVEAVVLTSLPLTVNVSGDGDMVLAVRAAEEFDRERPDGTEHIYRNDCAWSAAVESASVSIDNVGLADGCSYELQLTATDPDTGMTSETATLDFEVRWAHQAAEPSGSVDVREDERACTFTGSAPASANSTDELDVYRVTTDGVFPAAEKVPWGQLYIDRYAAYGDGDTAYRFVTRTAEGDEAWRDVAYSMGCGVVRIDWDDESVELSYNLDSSDERSKSAEVVTYFGGTRRLYVAPGLSRTRSLALDVPRSDAETLAAVRSLSRHEGLCHVRVPDGTAWCANVDAALSSDTGPIVGVDLDTTEADDVDGEFTAVRYDVG